MSKRKQAANKRNAQKSTGPKSPEGKNRVSQNARKHGFAAQKFTVIRLEDLNAVQDLRDDLVLHHHPRNSQELFALERIALHQNAMLRIEAVLAGFFTSCLNKVCQADDHLWLPLSEELVGDIESTRLQNRSYGTSTGMALELARSPLAFQLMLRYQAQTERLYRRAVEDLTRIQAETDALPSPDTRPIYDPPPAPQPPAAEAQKETPNKPTGADPQQNQSDTENVTDPAAARNQPPGQ